MAITITKRELAARVLDQITNHPESWNQEHWWTWGDEEFLKGNRNESPYIYDILRTRDECGTTGCVAGLTVAIAIQEGLVVAEGSEFISFAAQDLLQLSDNEASWLFRTYRTQEQVTAALRAIKNKKSLRKVMEKYGDDD